MIEIHRVTDATACMKYGAKGSEMVVVATQDGAPQGHCRFLFNGRVVLLCLAAENDDMVIAEALVKAAVAVYRDVTQEVECTADAGLLPAYRAQTGLFVDGVARLENLLRGNCF